MRKRIATLDEFWAHYLSEHRDARSRWLHFVGTTGWFASVAASAVMSPIAFPASMAAFALIMKRGLASERDRPAFLEGAAMMALPAIAAPLTFPAGVVFAYACAWAGHFGLEKNKPAT